MSVIGMLMLANSIGSGLPAIQAPAEDWSDQDPAQAEVITDYGIKQTVTE